MKTAMTKHTSASKNCGTMSDGLIYVYLESQDEKIKALGPKEYLKTC